MKTPLLSDLTSRLAPISDTPTLDASVLIAQIINKPRTWVMAHPELCLTTEQKKQLDDALARLERGESFPYILGHWEFFGLDFDITPDVLIPRPETELLVERAIAWLQEHSAKIPSALQHGFASQGNASLRVADVGTGSGAIAVCIATHIPDARLFATDISYNALEVARKNAIRFDVINRIDFVQCDLLPHPEPLSLHHSGVLRKERGKGVSAFDLICANLPYIPTKTLRDLPVYGREPTLALDGGPDGLDLIRRLLKIAPEWLAPNGMLLLEIEATRGVQALDIACEIFPEATIRLHQDLAGQDRLLEIMF